MNRFGRAAIGGAIAVGLLSAVPAAVFAAQPSCGDTLTSNTTLTADLDCSGYNGTPLYMGANGIVLNLNGHTIWQYVGDDGTTYGVYTNGYNRTVVKNGTIANGDYGVYIEYSNQTLVKNLEIYGEAADSSSSSGVGVYYGAGNETVNVNVHDTYYGWWSEYASNSHLLSSTITDTVYGAYTYYDSHDRLQNNVIDNASSYGFWDEYSGTNRYLGNTAKNGGGYGFYVYCEGYGTVTMKNNVAKDNSSDGFYTYECYQDNSYSPGYGSTFTGNQSIGNGGYGFYDYYSINSVWTNNVAKNNDDKGWYVEYPGGFTMTYNTANGNGGDGFYFYDNYSAGYYNLYKFSWNTANNNDGWGFEADYGAPGKGNHAKGNASGNCYNVRCS